MATIEYITKRVAGKEKEIDKLQKKLARIQKAEESGWQDNPYYYSEHDKKYTLRDLEEAKKALEKYKADLAIANEKANSRNVPAILEFLERWKNRCYEFYLQGLTEYFAEKDRVYRMYVEANELDWRTPEYKEAQQAYEDAYKAFRQKCNGYYEYFEEVRRGRTYRGEVKVRDGEYEAYKPYISFRNLDEAMARVQKDLEEEANRKYDFIIERTNEITGKITDASGLKVGSKDDLNGYIKGERGTAKVQTIGAGGWNIQCFHFRTLIHKAG